MPRLNALSAGTNPSDSKSPVASPESTGESRFITWRSFLLGSAFVTIVNALQPFNDYIVVNTNLIGSYIPVAMVLMFFALIVLINTPLHRLAPRYALSGGELSVVMAMTLAGCSIPSLFRLFIPSIVMPFYFGVMDQKFWSAVIAMDLPSWLFPVGDVAGGINSPIMSEFYGRTPPGQPIPYAAWIVPLAGWGIFLGAMMAASVAMAALVRYQWAVNERLAFPLARFQALLVESPRPGNVFNTLFRSRGFWVAMIAVLLVQSGVAMHRYLPKYFPAIPTSFDLNAIFSESPWTYMHWSLKGATVYFTFIGIAYFVQSRFAFSIWAIFFLQEMLMMNLRVVGYEVSEGVRIDQHVGASFAFTLGVLWIGRQQWWKIVRLTFRRSTSSENRGDFGSYRAASITLIVSIAVMFAWLVLLKVQFWVAAGLILFLLMAQFVVSRIVAETGLPFIRSYAGFPSIYLNSPASWFTSRDIFFSGLIHGNTLVPSREGVMPFTLHGMQVLDHAGAQPRTRGRMIWVIAWSLLLAYVICAVGSLWCYYSYASPIAVGTESMVNPYGIDGWPWRDVVAPVDRHAEGAFPPTAHNPWLNMVVGFIITSLLQFGSLRWTAWPLAPVGYIVSVSWYIQIAWFSIFLGWLAKQLIVRFGGITLYNAARPAFVGLIFGEALAAGVWLLINLLIVANGGEAKILRFLPS